MAAGNGVRDYTFGDRADSVLGGTMKNIASGFASTAGTLGEQYGRLQRMEEAREMDQLLAPLETFGGRALTGGIRDSNQLFREEQESVSHTTWASVTAAADRLGEDAAKDLRRAKEGLSKFRQAGIDVSEYAIEKGFDAAVGALTGGSNLPAVFVRTFGDAARESRRVGVSLDEQVLYGTAKGGVRVLTDKIAKFCGTENAESTANEVINKLVDSPTGKSFLKVLFNGGSEFAEELLNGIVDPLMKSIYQGIGVSPADNGNGYWSNIDFSELVYEALIGFTVGMLEGGTDTVRIHFR